MSAFMNLTELKTKPIDELLKIASEIGLDNLARSRKQDVIFSILKRHAKSGEDIYGDGVLEILPDGFGFLRSSLDTSNNVSGFQLFFFLARLCCVYSAVS